MDIEVIRLKSELAALETLVVALTRSLASWQPTLAKTLQATADELRERYRHLNMRACLALPADTARLWLMSLTEVTFCIARALGCFDSGHSSSSQHKDGIREPSERALCASVLLTYPSRPFRHPACRHGHALRPSEPRQPSPRS